MFVVAGAVVPVGGVLLAECFIEPLSGRMVRVGGASMRAGQLIPSTGGYQALLESKVQWDVPGDSVWLCYRTETNLKFKFARGNVPQIPTLSQQVLGLMLKTVELLKLLTDQSESQQATPQLPGIDGGNGGQGDLVTAGEDLREAWGRSLRCQLQLQTRLELLLGWAVCLQQDGGVLGEGMPVSG